MKVIQKMESSLQGRKFAFSGETSNEGDRCSKTLKVEVKETMQFICQTSENGKEDGAGEQGPVVLQAASLLMC